MIDLRQSLFTDIMPENLASQLETQAFAYAVGRQVEKLCRYADTVRVYAAVDDMPERILDVVAVELRTPSYNENYSLEVKRELVKATLPFYAKLGTPAAVNKMVNAIFGGGQIEEWFEYAGDPHHFRAVVNITDMEVKPGAVGEFTRIINSIKRLSSWLDAIKFFLTPAKSWALAGGAMVGSREKATATITPPPLEPPGGRFITVTGGGLLGMYRSIEATLKVPDLARPQGNAEIATGAACLGARQRFSVRLDTRGAVRPPTGRATTGCAAGVFHTYQRIKREVKIYGTLE